MRASVLKYVFSIVVLLCIVANIAAAPRNWDDEARARKADYTFLEAQNARAIGDYGTYFTLIRQAYLLDSTDLDIAADWGLMLMTGANADSADMERGYEYLRRLFLADPTNYSNGALVANLAAHMGKYDELVRTWEILDSIFPTSLEPAQELAKAYTIKSILGDTSALTKAMDIYNRLESGTGMNVALSSQKINVYLLQRDTLAVERELSALMQNAPADSYTALYIGSAYAAIGRPDSAITYYDLSCQLDSANGNAYMARANFYRQKGDSIAFDREVFMALGSSDLEVDTKIDILRSYVSDLYTDTLQAPRIRTLFDRLEQVHPGEPEIYALYGAYLYEIAENAEAADKLSYATSLDPSNESYWSEYTMISASTGDEEKAMEVALEAMQHFPDNLYFPTVAAIVLNRSDRQAEALELMESVDVSNVKNPDAVSNFLGLKGDLYSANGDTLRAIEVYDKAIQLNPDNIMALNNAAYFIALSGTDLDKAERYSQRAVKAEPSNPTYLDTYAWVFFKKKDYSLAKQYIDMTLRLYNDAEGNEESDNEAEEISPDVLEHAGDIYFMNGEPEAALDFWQRAFELDPDNELLARKVKHKTYFFK